MITINYNNFEFLLEPINNKNINFIKKKNYECLGVYFPNSYKIDFEIDINWIQWGRLGDPEKGHIVYHDYILSDVWCNTKEESFISLLENDIQKFYPFKINPLGSMPPIYYPSEGQKWNEAMSNMVLEEYQDWVKHQVKVKPEKFIILKKK